MRTGLVTFLVLAGVVAAAAQGSRRRDRADSNGAPGEFDFYMLSLSWAPGFCDMNDPNRSARECGTGNHVGFILHGLWPQKESGDLFQCGPASPVARDIVTRMLPLMMSAGLIQHEWRDHGTCSGLSPAAYFDTARKAFSMVRIPAEFQNLSRETQESPQQIAAKFADANPAFPRAAFHAQCKENELSEVRVCFSRNLTGRSCSPGECRAPRLRVLPLR